MEHMIRAGIVLVGQLLERARGDEGLLSVEGIGPEALSEIKQSLEKWWASPHRRYRWQTLKRQRKRRSLKFRRTPMPKALRGPEAVVAEADEDEEVDPATVSQRHERRRKWR